MHESSLLCKAEEASAAGGIQKNIYKLNLNYLLNAFYRKPALSCDADSMQPRFELTNIALKLTNSFNLQILRVPVIEKEFNDEVPDLRLKHCLHKQST